MAVDVQTWEDGILGLFGELSGIPTDWRDQPRAFLAPQDVARCLIKVIGDVPLGVDETRVELDPTAVASSPPVELLPSQVGLRIVSLQIQVESYDQDATARARRFIGQVVTRIRRSSSRRALQVLDTSVIDISPAAYVQRVVDERAYGLGTLTIRLHTIVDERDKAFGRIDTIALTATIDDPTGSPAQVLTFTIDLPDP